MAEISARLYNHKCIGRRTISNVFSIISTIMRSATKSFGIIIARHPSVSLVYNTNIDTMIVYVIETHGNVCISSAILIRNAIGDVF